MKREGKKEKRQKKGYFWLPMNGYGSTFQQGPFLTNPVSSKVYRYSRKNR
jgi:hypothetical protein